MKSEERDDRNDANRSTEPDRQSSGKSRLHPKGSRLTPVKKEHRYMAETNLNQLQKWLN